MDKNGGKDIWDAMWSESEETDENSFIRCVVETVIHHCPIPLSNAKILEAGSGTGTSSFQLAKLGAFVTLVDYSEAAIHKAERMFKRSSMSSDFLVSDIRKMDIESNTYDVVFNSGVMEHFPYDEQVRILQELSRVCKSGGFVITMNPNAKCIFYRIWKWILETNKQWIYGYEQPVVTLVNQYRDAGLRLLSEYSVGFELAMEQFGVFPEFRTAAYHLLQFYSQLPEGERQFVEGYLLCSVGKK